MKLSNLELLEGIKSQDKRILGKAITLVESKKPEHRAQAEELLKMVLPLSGKSIRIGITGVPGAGKSTFIESFGKLAIENGKKVAVLAIDGITPDVFVGENLLRYESRWVRRLPQQLRVPEVKGRTLYDATFYHYIIDLWAKNYFSIQKIKKQKNEAMNEIKDVKSAANYIISVALQRLPPDEVQNLLEEMKAKRVFRDAKYYTRLRQKLKNITTNSATRFRFFNSKKIKIRIQ
jgi:ribosome biogenesis GTPase A